MAGKHSSKRNPQTRKAKGRRRARAIGLSGGAGAFLALGLGPLASAPAAHADDFGILDTIIGSLSSAAPALGSGLDGWLASLDASLGAASAVDPTSGVDAALSAVSTADPASSVDAALTGASALDTTSATTPFAEFMNNLEQGWINSSFGGHVDTVLNNWADHANPSLAASDSCGVICNGANGTAMDPNGGDGGTLFGNGGAGYTYTALTDPTGAAKDGGMGGDALGHGNGG